MTEEEIKKEIRDFKEAIYIDPDYTPAKNDIEALRELKKAESDRAGKDDE